MKKIIATRTGDGPIKVTEYDGGTMDLQARVPSKDNMKTCEHIYIPTPCGDQCDTCGLLRTTIEDNCTQCGQSKEWHPDQGCQEYDGGTMDVQARVPSEGEYETLRKGYEEVQMMHSSIENAYPEAYRLARKFHELYEEQAPFFGYITNPNSREFYPNSNNGRLMAYVCKTIVDEEKAKWFAGEKLILQAKAEERSAVKKIVDEIFRRSLKEFANTPLDERKHGWDCMVKMGDEILKAINN